MAIAILCFARATCAQEASTSTTVPQVTPAAASLSAWQAENTLQTVTVTDSGLDTHAWAAPVSVLEETSWQLRRSPTLGDSLTAEPGIHASHFGAGASRPVIRGMDGPRVAVLSSGMELHDASTLSPDHAVVADTSLAEKVEIWRGPAALVHGGAVGGAVNVVDAKIPSALPTQPVQGSLDTQWSSNAHGKTAALGLTAAAGPLALRLEAAGHQAGNYRPGRGWQSASSARRLPNSHSEVQTGTLGLSWIGPHAYLGAAYTRQTAQYGLPGHQHSDCHPHGLHLDCGDHAHSMLQPRALVQPDPADHSDDQHAHGAHPLVDLHSHRWDVRGEWRQLAPALQAVRFKASHTRYAHDELEAGTPVTAFHNRAHDLRLEVQHVPLAGWRGMLGVSQGQGRLHTQGAQAHVQPTTTQKLGVFMFEQYQAGAWTWQAAWRHDRQSVQALSSATTRQHQGNSASLGSIWRLAPGVQGQATWSRAQRMPSAPDLFANGLHAATNSWEVGNAQLHKETTQGWDLGLRQTHGNTTWSVATYRHRVHGYIYARTVDEDHGFTLRHTTQATARFTGAEAQLRQRLNRWMGATVFGDTVRARLADGSHLPRIPAARLGLRIDGSWHGWEGMAEWVQVFGQSRTAPHETATPGYGTLNLAAHYQWPGSGVQLTFKAENLTDRLGYAHTSAIKNAAPLKGRNISVGLRSVF